MRRFDRSNTHCKREPARTLRQRRCAHQSWNCGTTQSLCRSMGAMPMTSCLVHLSSLPSKPPCRNWSPSCGFLMDSYRLTAGGTVRAIATTSPKARAVSKVIRWPRPLCIGTTWSSAQSRLCDSCLGQLACASRRFVCFDNRRASTRRLRHNSRRRQS